MTSKKVDYGTKLVIYLFFCLSVFSCTPKAGCPASENATVKVNRKGELPTKRGNSTLFSPNGSVKVKKAQKARKQQRKKIYSKRKS
jgi:hypothetical protein